MLKRDYPLNVLRWLGIKTVNVDIQYDRIDDVLNHIIKGYCNPQKQELIKDIFISRFLLGLDPKEMIDQGFVKGISIIDVLMLLEEIRNTIRQNSIYMDYLSMLRNTIRPNLQRINCDILDYELRILFSEDWVDE